MPSGSSPRRSSSSSGATDLLPGRAAELVAASGGRDYGSLDELLADDAVETVVNLTAPAAHAAVTARVPRGGQARPHREAGRAARRRGARARRARRAPRRPPQLLARDAARRGAADGVEARPRRAHRPGPCRLRRGELGADRALAPVAGVAVRGRAARRRRHLSADDPDGDVRPGAARLGVRDDRAARAHAPDGATFTLGTPDFYVAVVEHESGVVTRLTATFWVDAGRQRGLELHGDEGSLWMPTWAEFDSRLELTDRRRDLRAGAAAARALRRHRLGAAARRPRRGDRRGPTAPDGRRACGARGRGPRGHRRVAPRGGAVARSTFDPPPPLDWAT